MVHGEYVNSGRLNPETGWMFGSTVFSIHQFPHGDQSEIGASEPTLDEASILMHRDPALNLREGRAKGAGVNDGAMDVRIDVSIGGGSHGDIPANQDEAEVVDSIGYV